MLPISSDHQPRKRLNDPLYDHPDLEGAMPNDKALCLLAAIKAAGLAEQCHATVHQKNDAWHRVVISVTRDVDNGNGRVLPWQVTPEIQTDFDGRVSNAKAFLDAANVPYVAETEEYDRMHCVNITIDTNSPGCTEAIGTLMNQHKAKIVARYGNWSTVLTRPDGTVLDSDQAARVVAEQIALLQKQVRGLTTFAKQQGFHQQMLTHVGSLNPGTAARTA